MSKICEILNETVPVFEWHFMEFLAKIWKKYNKISRKIVEMT